MAKKENLTKQDDNWVNYLKEVRETSMNIAEQNQKKKGTTEANVGVYLACLKSKKKVYVIEPSEWED